MAQPPQQLFGPKAGDWRRRLEVIVATMREMSLQSDPQAMVRAYGAQLRKLMPTDHLVSLSRRELDWPRYRITRSSRWKEEINPWLQKDRLPLLEGGLLGELLYGDEPRVLDDFDPDPEDPAFEFLAGQRSLLAIPIYDRGVALNMTVLMRAEPRAFDHDVVPEHVWMTNLFGRATQNLVLSAELKRAYETVERELAIVAGIQRSLLPKTLPTIPTLGLAAHYQTSRWAGGDYYDIFGLPDGRWTLLIADVSGHGTPAAVLMAVVHTLAHSYPGSLECPGDMLAWLNDRLAERYTTDNEAFVTAFCGLYHPEHRTLTYASAGHNPPRLKRCQDGSVASLDCVGGLPLGLFAGQSYATATRQLIPGDEVVFYTDGITEATDPAGTMFGLDRLDEALENCHLAADGLIREVLSALDRFTAGQPPADDRTMVVAKVS